MTLSKPKRRWYQFTLRTLFVAMTALAVALGYVMYERQAAFVQKETVRELARLGVETHYDAEASRRPEWLKELLGDDALTHISFARFLPGRAVESNQAMSNAVDKLSEFQHLRRVAVNDPRLDDGGFAQLCRLTQLEELYVEKTQVTDQGLANIKQLDKLWYLFLGGTKISDGGLRELRGLKDLEVLNLQDTTISDFGLKELSHLKRLKVLNLRGTKVTEAGIAELTKALPNCEIVSPPNSAEIRNADSEDAAENGPRLTLSVDFIEFENEFLEEIGRKLPPLDGFIVLEGIEAFFIQEILDRNFPNMKFYSRPKVSYPDGKKIEIFNRPPDLNDPANLIEKSAWFCRRPCAFQVTPKISLPQGTVLLTFQFFPADRSEPLGTVTVADGVTVLAFMNSPRQGVLRAAMITPRIIETEPAP